mmetsp:Transcript_24964/g.58582  ORF Transcript_24964/g.58582 Transcript_24964/m.58582 type:complete len:116 (-) Transcript_24964:913-1260(-)
MEHVMEWQGIDHVKKIVVEGLSFMAFAFKLVLVFGEQIWIHSVAARTEYFTLLGGRYGFDCLLLERPRQDAAKAQIKQRFSAKVRWNQYINGAHEAIDVETTNLCGDGGERLWVC